MECDEQNSAIVLAYICTHVTHSLWSFTIIRQNMPFIAHNVVIFTMLLLLVFFPSPFFSLSVCCFRQLFGGGFACAGSKQTKPKTTKPHTKPCTKTNQTAANCLKSIKKWVLVCNDHVMRRQMERLHVVL